MDGVKFEKGKSLSAIIRGKQISDTIKLKILYKDSEKEVMVKLEKAPKSL